MQMKEYQAGVQRVALRQATEIAGVRQEKRRGFQPPWYWVRIYRCPRCKHETTINRNWHGPAPTGAFPCYCGAAISIATGEVR